jgi:hypothetical protein
MCGSWQWDIVGENVKVAEALLRVREFLTFNHHEGAKIVNGMPYFRLRRFILLLLWVTLLSNSCGHC